MTLKKRAAIISSVALMPVLVVLAFSIANRLSNRGWNSSRGSQGTEPLFFAKTKAEAEALVANGADVNHHSEYGFTPLHFAAARGQADIVSFLLDHGANVNAKGDDGDTPLHWAAKVEFDPDEGKHYIPAPYDRKGKAEAARVLVARGANVNAQNTSNRSPLFQAAHGNTALAKFLLETGANANATDVSGFNPLHEVGNAEIATLLIEHGANVNARDKWEHRTPLFFAHDRDVAKVIKAHGGTE